MPLPLEIKHNFHDYPDFPDEDGGKHYRISAVVDDAEVGHLEYVDPQEAVEAIKLLMLSVEPESRGQGIARNLIEKLCGAKPDRQITATITHEESVTYFEQFFNEVAHVSDRSEYTVDTKPELSKIPLVKVLRAGGIEVTRVTAIYNSRQIVAKNPASWSYTITLDAKIPPTKSP